MSAPSHAQGAPARAAHAHRAAASLHTPNAGKDDKRKRAVKDERAKRQKV
jgi:hypothetical protein